MVNLRRIATIVIPVCVILLMMSFSCKSKKQTTVYTTLERNPTQVNWSVNDSVALAKGENVRLIISIISIGEGPDREALNDINLHLRSFGSAIKKPIQYVLVFWGREGETDVCFRLQNLTLEEQAMFAEDMRKMFAQRPLVQIFENQPCNHIR